MKLMLLTQYRENYGAHEWDGKGECPQYWKNKGGMHYYFPLGNVVDFNAMSTLVAQLAAKINRFNDYVEEFVIDWSVEADDYLTPFELDQLEYEGVITHRPEEVKL